ncbi:MAG: substrate-binding domain-containing protein [Candidatus Brocadiia bacterium]
MPATRTVAVLYDPDAMDFRQRETLRGVHGYAAEHRPWRVVLAPFAAEAGDAPYDGLIAPARKGLARRLVRSPVPAVCVTWGFEQHRLVRAVENRRRAGRLAARHLAEQGCRAFAYVGFTKQTASRVERETFTDELRRRGRPVERARTFVSYPARRPWWEEVMRSLGDWLVGLPRPAGLLVARPGFARALAHVALARGLSVPGDVALMAADHDPLVCELDPPLTAVAFDYSALGRQAAEALDRLMAGEPLAKRRFRIEPTLVARRSTDLRSAADPVVARALAFIHDRRAEPIRPSDVATALGVSGRRLRRRMRQARGRTVAQEIALARLEAAKDWLQRSDLPAAAVALESGFASYAAMLRAFRRHLGTTPAAWRRAATESPAHPPARR